LYKVNNLLRATLQMCSWKRLTLQGIRESTQSPVSVTSLTAKEDDRQEKVPS